MSVHTIAMPIEDAAERLTDTLLCENPIDVVALGGSSGSRRDAHTL